GSTLEQAGSTLERPNQTLEQPGSTRGQSDSTLEQPTSIGQPPTMVGEQSDATLLPADAVRTPADEASVPAPAPAAPASAELKLPVAPPVAPAIDLDAQPSTTADLRKLINQPRKPGPPKKELRTALDRPAARQPIRRDYDQYEDQPGDRPARDDFRASPAPRRPASRRTPEQMARLWMSVGEAHGVAPGDVVGCILGETGLPGGTVGVVDIRERHTFVDVAAESANAIIAKLNRTTIRGQRLKVKFA
ncbi:MAG: hypothetical protein EB141_17450, partial [Verrucomicrobia bacterium]|nr:hypothetical protein [Verrucomicrobiota bacterium]NDB77399.1 hypothetical protein [Verrucomicrobiota bacterium]NDD39712.1 hypothetical protein [Verrucomicrobiota bacterium]NDE99916.1 hypothetical protein [Verrucomicrobiota bacterium]